MASRLRLLGAVAGITAASLLPGRPTAQATPTAPQAAGTTVWISELQVVWGPAWNASGADTVNVLAYQASTTDTAWIGRCNQMGGEPVLTTHGVRQCEDIDH